MMTRQILETLSRYCATGVIDSILEGSAIALLAFSLLRLLRRHNAGTRFVILLASLVATGLVPLIRSVNGLSASGVHSSLLQIEESWIPWIAAMWAIMATVGLARVDRKSTRLNSSHIPLSR